MIINGVDGVINAADLYGKSCCPKTLCDLSLCDMVCSFVHLLPSGPLWDEAKTKVMSHYKSSGCNGGHCPPEPQDCTTLVAHSIYTATRSHYLLMEGLWPLIRESRAETAFTTMDDWLERLGWVDCYGTACRSPALGAVTPYEVPTDCGPIFCAPSAPPELSNLVKRGIILSLIRLQMGVIKNIDGINFVIEPLGAKLEPYVPLIAPDPALWDGNCALELALSPISLTQKKWVQQSCPQTPEQILESNSDIDIFYDISPCDNPGLPGRLFPTILAAECIIRSILPQNSSFKIIRTC